MDRPKSTMDLAEIAKGFDNAIEEQLSELLESVPNRKRVINPDVAKSIGEWAALLNVNYSMAYRILSDKVDSGEWERVGLTGYGVAGRAKFYYYEKGRNPFLDVEDEK